MTGRGKGGKGLGKGGAKRHRKILRDNIQGTIDQRSNVRCDKACYQKIGQKRWCKKNLWSDL
jgi:hypothetical protein